MYYNLINVVNISISSGFGFLRQLQKLPNMTSWERKCVAAGECWGTTLDDLFPNGKDFEALLPKWLRQGFDLPMARCQIGRSWVEIDGCFVQSPARHSLKVSALSWTVSEDDFPKDLRNKQICYLPGYVWTQPLDKTLQFECYTAKHDDWYINTSYNHSTRLRNNFLCYHFSSSIDTQSPFWILFNSL